MGAIILTGEQIRAGRALARIEQTELAARTRLSLETIKRHERMRGQVEANSRTLAAIRNAFEAIGVAFDSCEDGGVGVCRLPEAASRGQNRPARPASTQLARPIGGGPPLQRLIFFSAAVPEVARHMKPALDDIGRIAAKRNAELGVTGALFACCGSFLQVLEGRKDAVMQVFGEISSDPRHKDLVIRDNRVLSAPHFQDWTLCCGLFESDDAAIRLEPALQGGFNPEALTVASALGLLSLMQDLQARPPRMERGHGRCLLADRCLDGACAASAGKAGFAEA